MSATLETDGRLLLVWLNLLGWRIDVERDDGLSTGVAIHGTSDGSILRVRAEAESDAELGLRLFERAMHTLEASRAAPSHHLAA